MSFQRCLLALLVLCIVSHTAQSSLLPTGGLPVQVRVIQPRDLEGTFQLFDSTEGSACPQTIEHTRLVASSDGVTVPHTAIKHDGTNCMGPGSLSQISMEAFGELPEAQDLNRESPDPAEQLRQQLAELERRGVVFALEESERKCPSAPFPARTVVILMTVDEDILQEAPMGSRLQQGDRIMAIMELQNGALGSSCFYSARPRASGNCPNCSNPAARLQEDDGACFPAGAIIRLKDGAEKPISELQLGDAVYVGHSEHSEVFMFTHRLADTAHEFVRLITRADALTATPGHYVYINDKLAAAGTARVGDKLTRADGAPAEIVRVQKVWDTGLYNPQTLHGDIVVDGFRASTYTMAVEPTVANTLLAPFRGLYRLGVKMDPISRWFDHGVGSLGQWAPKGLHQYS